MPSAEPGQPTEEQLKLALAVLARLLRDEYPDGLTLVDIALRWGYGISDRELAALDAVERAL